VKIEAADLDPDRPITPSPLKEGINFKRLFSPIRDPLPLVHFKGQAAVFDPGTEARPVLLPDGEDHRDAWSTTAHGLASPAGSFDFDN
jgi:hypothetical protein